MLYFLHIPKTAGTSFRAFLDNHYHSYRHYPGSVLGELAQEKREALNRYELFSGHFGWFLHGLVSKKVTTITMLRDPIARTLSQYKHIKRGPEFAEFYRWYKDLNLSEFLENADRIFLPLFLNAQTSALALDEADNEYSELNCKAVDDIFALLTDESLLRKAMHRLEQLAFVGIVEDFERSMECLCDIFGWLRPSPTSYHMNVAPDHELANSYSLLDLRMVNDFNGLDNKLYIRGCELFNDLYASMLAKGDEANYRSKMKARRRHKVLHLGFEKPLIGFGWYGREVQPDGSVCRWTGPEVVSVLDVRLAGRREYEISFCAAAYTEDILLSARLMVNGCRVALVIDGLLEHQLHHERVFRGVIGEDIVQRNECYTRLEFSVAETVCPIELDPSCGDSRRLGIFVKWIRLDPHLQPLAAPSVGAS